MNADRCADIVVGGSAAPTATLTAPTPHHFGMFGRSLAAHGDLLAIGSPGDVSDGVHPPGAEDRKPAAG